jgi:alkylation response protein AidB-like acyl-CoA dehydrogenase
MFLEVVAQMARVRVAPVAHSIDESGRLDGEVLGLLREHQVLTAGLSEAYGGAGTDPFLGVLVIEQIAAASASLAVPALMAHGCGYALELAGERAGGAAKNLQEGGLAVLVCPGAAPEDSPPQSACLADIASLFLLAARDEENDRRCLWALDPAAVELGQAHERTGLHGVEIRDLRAAAAAGSPVGGEPSFHAARNWWLLGWAAVAAGIGRAAIEAAGGYMLERRQFGQPLAQFPALRQMLAAAESRLAGVVAQLHQAARRDDVLDAAAGPLCAAAAQAAGAMAVAVTIDAVQLHGGYGYVCEYPVERLMRDAISVRARIGGSRTTGSAIADSLLGGVSA